MLFEFFMFSKNHHKLYTIKFHNKSHFSWFTNQEFISPLVGVRTTSKSIKNENIVVTAKEDHYSDDLPLIIKDSDGNYEFLFDVSATLDFIRYEKYPGSALKDSIASYLPFDYTQLPMWLIGTAYRALNKPIVFSKLPKFPSYPLDFSADLLTCLLTQNHLPIQWPDQKQYAIVFTHDVDTEWVFDSSEGKKWLHSFLMVEKEYGIRSAWYCVPTSIKSTASKNGLKNLLAEGHEIGIHGLTHDPNLPKLSFNKLQEKFTDAKKLMMPYCNEFGYRAPWLSRSETMYKALSASGYLYDTSLPTSDVQRNNIESNNGCCTVFPFKRENMVVLPITLPQDCMRLSLSMSAERFWNWIYDLIKQIKEAGGLALVSTHIQPHHSANEPMLIGYKKLLNKLSKDNEAWTTLPKEVAQWTKRS